MTQQTVGVGRGFDRHCPEIGAQTALLIGRLDGAVTTVPGVLSVSLAEAAAAGRASLTKAAPDAQMWCLVGGGGSAFYARRFAYEPAMHRARAARALGVDYPLDPNVAVDAIDE